MNINYVQSIGQIVASHRLLMILHGWTHKQQAEMVSTSGNYDATEVHRQLHYYMDKRRRQIAGRNMIAFIQNRQNQTYF